MSVEKGLKDGTVGRYPADSLTPADEVLALDKDGNFRMSGMIFPPDVGHMLRTILHEAAEKYPNRKERLEKLGYNSQTTLIKYLLTEYYKKKHGK